MVSYALNPNAVILNKQRGLHNDKGVMEGFMKAIKKIYGPNSKEASLIPT